MQQEIIIEAYACDDYGDGPCFAKVIVNDFLVEKIKTLASIIEEHGLSEVRVYMSPEDWGPSKVVDELRLQGGELVVIPGGDFWFTDKPKHADYSVETRAVSLDTVLKGIEAGEYIFGRNVDDLRELLEEEIDTTEVA